MSDYALKLKKILEKYNYNLINKLSFEERIKLIEFDSILCHASRTLEYAEIIKLLRYVITEEEASYLYDNYQVENILELDEEDFLDYKKDYIKVFYNLLNTDEKIEKSEEILDSYREFYIATIHTNKEDRVRFINHGFQTNKIDFYYMYQYMDLLEKEDKIKFYEKMINSENNLTVFFSNECFNCFNELEIKNLFFMYDNKFNTHNIDSIVSFLMRINMEERVDYLLNIIDKNKISKTYIKVESLKFLFDSLDTKNKIKLIINLLDRKVIDLSTVNYLIKEMNYDDKVELTDLIITNNNYNITEEYINALINNLNLEQSKDIIKKYVLDKKLIPLNNLFEVITKNEEIKYFLIDYIIENKGIKTCLDNKELFDEFFTAYKKYPDGNNIYMNIIRLYSEYNNMDYYKILKLVKKFGYRVLLYLEFDNFKKLVKLEDNELDKILNIFDIENGKLTNDKLNDISNMLLQREFRIYKPDIYNIFGSFEKDIKNIKRNTYKILDNLSNINNSINITKILEKYNLSMEEFAKYLVSDTDKYINILDEISEEFIKHERKKYSPEKLKENLNKLDIYNISSKFKENIINTNKNILDKLININNSININKILEKYNLSIEEFAKYLISDTDKYINILHEITDEFIKHEREKYCQENLKEYLSKLNITKKIEKNIYKKELINSNDKRFIYSKIRTISFDKLTDEEIKLSNNKELLNKLYDFKINHIISNDIKPYLRIYDSLLNKVYENSYDANDCKIYDINMFRYFPDDVDIEFLLESINKLDIDSLINNTINNKDVYEDLINFLDNNKVLGYGKIFTPVINNADLLYDENILASLINNYYIIRKNEDKKLTKCLDYAVCYDQASNLYTTLMDEDNYILYSSNIGKNKSKTTRDYRLKEVPDLVRKMYSRKVSTIPGIKEKYGTSSGKNINVNISNSTNMINLTYGERTDACLRIGGVFDDLFKFCLEDKNGFHVRFSDSKNNFITRVSGLRNGNTIFLNELRNSTDPNYSNDEIIEVLKKVSSDLIELTKDDKTPVENVVISTDYAMCNDKNVYDAVFLDKDPFYGKSFNIYDGGSLVLLKGKNNKLNEYKFGEETSTYLPVRDELRCSKDIEESKTLYLKTILIKNILEGKNLEDIEYTIPDNIIFSYAGEDFCTYLDSNNNINTIKVFDNKNYLSEAEINKSINYIKNKFNIDLVEGKSL